MIIIENISCQYGWKKGALHDKFFEVKQSTIEKSSQTLYSVSDSSWFWCRSGVKK